MAAAMALLLAQGSAVPTHAENADRIMVPVRVDTALACPPSVRAQIDGLYRWQLERQERPGPITITGQRQRFTPQLFDLLERAYALTPADGRFVDFDLFSGTQVNTYGATLEHCSWERRGRLSVRVAVWAGLRGRAAEQPQQLRYVFRLSPSDGWRIADIVYPGEPSFRLSTYLRQLLQEQP